MFRSILCVMALAAVLATAACNSMTGLNSAEVNRAPGSGGDRTPQQFESPKDYSPDPGDGSGGGPGGNGTVLRQVTRRMRSPGEIAPEDPGSSGGGDGQSDTSRRRQGQGGRQENAPHP